jgi:hypothetical protein
MRGVLDVIEQQQHPFAGQPRTKQRCPLRQASWYHLVAKAKRPEETAEDIADTDATTLAERSKVRVQLAIAKPSGVIMRPVGPCRALADAVPAKQHHDWRCSDSRRTRCQEIDTADLHVPIHKLPRGWRKLPWDRQLTDPPDWPLTRFVLALPASQVLDGVGGLLSINQGMVMGAQKDQIGLSIELIRRKRRIAARTLTARGNDMRDLPDYGGLISIGGISHDWGFAPRICAATFRLAEQDLDGLLGVFSRHQDLRTNRSPPARVLCCCLREER